MNTHCFVRMRPDKRLAEREFKDASFDLKPVGCREVVGTLTSLYVTKDETIINEASKTRVSTSNRFEIR